MDWGTMGGHSIIIAMLGYIARALHVNGIRFDIRIWRNGNGSSGNGK